jgi:DNA-binding winged helix-turn-helix (wHTH) protein
MQLGHFESQYPVDSRKKELDKLLSYIKEGNSAQLLGLPGYGRSNVLRFLTYSSAIRKAHLGKDIEKFHFVLVDFSEVRKRDLFDVTKFIFLCLSDSLLERHLQEEYTRVHGLFREALLLKDELMLFQALKQALDYLATERMMNVVFLFDRFDEYIPTVTPEFFTNLRSLRDRVKYQFNVVFSLTRPLEDVLEADLLSDFYEFVAGHLVYVALCDTPSLLFRLDYLENITKKKLTEEKRNELFMLTGGHGRLMRICAEAALVHTGQEDLKTYLLKQKTVHDALKKVWKALTPSEQHTLSHIPTTGDEKTTNYLIHIGLLQGDTLGIPLLEAFFEDHIEQDITPERITFDENTQEIKKGDVVLSDGLTSSEYRLLTFLVHNNERILEREEIIQAIWDENKSIAGVTDQALDQLIFRLRKKIEDNPNAPSHLQTVKGRGFKFTL